jgi:hypothetical protein
VTSMGERHWRLSEAARNPQRRPVGTLAAGRRVPTRGMPTAPGRPLRTKPSIVTESGSYETRSLPPLDFPANFAGTFSLEVPLAAKR